MIRSRGIDAFSWKMLLALIFSPLLFIESLRGGVNLKYCVREYSLKFFFHSYHQQFSHHEISPPRAVAIN